MTSLIWDRGALVGMAVVYWLYRCHIGVFFRDEVNKEGGLRHHQGIKNAGRDVGANNEDREGLRLLPLDICDPKKVVLRTCG